MSLSRDSHCNIDFMNEYPRHPTEAFQSLYRGAAIATYQSKLHRIDKLMFQSLYRGTAIATGRNIVLSDLKRCFNPSIEGQPLQHGMFNLTKEKIMLFQSLYRGTAIATVYGVLPLHLAALVSIPLSRDSHCN